MAAKERKEPKMQDKSTFVFFAFLRGKFSIFIRRIYSAIPVIGFCYQICLAK